MAQTEFVLTPSKKLAYFLYGLHIIAAVVILTLQVSVFKKGVIFIVFLIFGYREINGIIKSQQRRNQDEIARVWHDTEGRFGLETLKGKKSIGTLKGDSFKCSWFIILRIKLLGSINARTITLFIPKDALPPSEYRALCARLVSY